MKKLLSLRGLLMALLGIALALGACTPRSGPAKTALPNTPALPTASPAPQATAVPLPRSFRICSAQEPPSLYRYDEEDSPSRNTLFDLLFDGFYEQNLAGNGSGLLSAAPGLGDMISIEPVKLSAGALVVNALGEVVPLQKGMQVRKAACSGQDCLISWDGASELAMDQMTVKFKLNPAQKWSDGSPLTAEDYLFSYKLMRQAANPAQQKHMALTQSLMAADEHTLEWKALPGFAGVSLENFLPWPMPQHQLAGLKPEELPASPLLREETLGWGPYVIKDWQANGTLLLEANPHYYRAAEGLPKMPELSVRFIPTLQEALQAFQAGECEILDDSYNFFSMNTAEWAPYLGHTDFHLRFSGQAVELVFGIRPAVYDNDHQAALNERPDWFGDPRTRQAISMSMARAQLNQALYGPHLPAEVQVAPASIFGPDAKPETLLEEAGWKLADGSRVALGVAGVKDGTAFKISLLAGQGQAERELTDLVVSALGNMGIEVSTNHLPVSQLYAPGPEGPLFGRNFELALVSWQTGALERCTSYYSRAIPSAANRWIGSNLAGLSSEAFDLACAQNLFSMEPVSPSNAGIRCSGICKAYLEESPSVAAADRLGLWLSSKSLANDSDWALNQIEWMVKQPAK
ncbi:MAG: ABC transporter substrate-binding protein [Anaerolineaceae bacterium]|nr:ABC transporter substrate-binding protein [Anaerolineaceae bacterium]